MRYFIASCFAVFKRFIGLANLKFQIASTLPLVIAYELTHGKTRPYDNFPRPSFLR